MPDLTPYASIFRSRERYHYTGWLASFPYETVLTGTVTATPSFPALTVAYTLNTGDVADVVTDMLVVFYSSTGVRKGQTRVAQATVTTTSLPIGETSAGSINIVSGDTFSVFNVFLLFDKLVSNTSALNKDSRITISDNTSNPPPVANGGGPWVGFVDPGQSYATVERTAADSFTVDPDSAGTLTYLWSVGDGTITVGTTTTEAITVQFPAGFRTITLTVTDTGNSKTATKQIPIRVYDANDMPVPVIMRSLSGDVQNGWSAEFETPAATGASIDDLPDGAMVLYFEQEYYGTTQASYGSATDGSSHIKFAGYLVRDNTEINAEDDTLTFFAESPLMILDKTPALPQYIKNKTVPNQWRFVKSLTVNRILWYLLYWHSTYMTSLDFIWFDGTDLAYREIAVKETSSPAAQLRDVAQSINCNVTCDRLGTIRVIRSPNQLTLAERAARTTTYDLTTADVVEVSMEREHRGEVKLVTAGGITAGVALRDANSVFSKSPGTAPGHRGTGSIEKNDYIVPTGTAGQDAINRICGLYDAELNSLYNGQFVPKGVTLTLPDGYDVFDPAYREFVTFTLPAATNKRGIGFDDTVRWTLDRVSINYDAETGEKDVQITISHETFGPDGPTFIKPQRAQNGLQPFPPLLLTYPQITPIVYPSPFPAPGAGTLAVMDVNSTGRFVRTDDFNTPSWSGGPTWTAITLTGSVSGTWLDWVGDAFTPGAGWLVTTTNIYRITDLFGAATATNQHTFAAPVATPGGVGIGRRRIPQATRTTPNFVAVASYYTPGGISVAVTTDGSTWTETNVTTHYNTSATAFAIVEPIIYVSEHQANTIYTGAFTATGSGTAATAALYKSTNSGATWAVDAGRMTNSVRVGDGAYWPYQNNPNDNVFYWTNSSTGSTLVLTRTTGPTQTAIDPNPLVNTSGIGRNGLSASDDNRLRMMCCYGRFNVSTFFGLAVSLDGGSTWIDRIPEATSNRWLRCFMVNDNAAYLLGDGTNRVGYTSDFAATIDNRTGNLGTGNYVKVIGPGT